MRTLAVIPARRGSQGIPNKNVAPCGNKRLIEHTLQAAKDSCYINDIAVTTDDSRIEKEANRYHVDYVLEQPLLNAAGVEHAVYCCFHTLDRLERQGEEYEAVIMLLPTAPLREVEDIDGSLGTLAHYNCESVVGVYKTKPLVSLRYVNDRNFLQMVDPKHHPNGQRQTQHEIYAVNGAIFAAEVAALRKFGSFHNATTRPWVMPAYRSIDIDDMQDLELANMLLEK